MTLSTKPSPVAIHIFGDTFKVRTQSSGEGGGSGGSDPQHLQRLADLVDEKMKEVASQVATSDPSRIAILAALNLADELVQLERADRWEEDRSDFEARVSSLAEELEGVLSESTELSDDTLPSEDT